MKRIFISSNLLTIIMSFFCSPSLSQFVPLGFFSTSPIEAPYYVSSSSTRTSDTDTTMNITNPGLEVGDLMVVFVGKSNTDTVSGPVGWTHHSSETVTTYGIDFLSKVADASDVLSGDFQFTWGTAAYLADRHGIITTFRNIADINPVDFFVSNSGAGSTATYLGGVTTYDNSLVITIATSFTMPSTPTGFTVRNSDGWATKVSDKVETTAGTVGSYTSTASTNWGTATFAITGKVP